MKKQLTHKDVEDFISKLRDIAEELPYTNIKLPQIKQRMLLEAANIIEMLTKENK